VEADDIDILCVQAPDCKGLPASIETLLNTARTSVLVYRPGGAASETTHSSAWSSSLGTAIAAADAASV
jgi:hypothetical protein